MSGQSLSVGTRLVVPDCSFKIVLNATPALSVACLCFVWPFGTLLYPALKPGAAILEYANGR
jgi:hypothetical protein